MPQSPLRLIEKCAEFKGQEDICLLPKGVRGIYVLYNKRQAEVYDVVYVGMAAVGGIRGRLNSHKRKKAGLWSRFSVFKVWDNIRNEEIRELEGLFRHLYRRDSKANKLNKQKGFRAMRKIRKKSLSDW